MNSGNWSGDAGRYPGICGCCPRPTEALLQELAEKVQAHPGNDTSAVPAEGDLYERIGEEYYEHIYSGLLEDG